MPKTARVPTFEEIVAQKEASGFSWAAICRQAQGMNYSVVHRSLQGPAIATKATRMRLAAALRALTQQAAKREGKPNGA